MSHGRIKIGDRWHPITRSGVIIGAATEARPYVPIQPAIERPAVRRLHVILGGAAAVAAGVAAAAWAWL